MRVVRLVAGGVLAVGDVDRVVLHLFHVAAHQPAVALLRGYALDLRLGRLDVVGDGVHRVGGAALREDRAGRSRFALHRIGLSVGVDLLIVHVHAHEVGLQVHVLIGDVALVVDVYHLVAHVVDQRVAVLARDDVVEEGAAALFGGGVGRRRVDARSVRFQPFADQRIDTGREERVAPLRLAVLAGHPVAGPAFAAGFGSRCRTVGRSAAAQGVLPGGQNGPHRSVAARQGLSEKEQDDGR